MTTTTWKIYRKAGKPHDGIEQLGDPPPWRAFDTNGEIVERDLGIEQLGQKFRPNDAVVELVNAALHLRRPLLITGKPGTGKSSLARSVAYQLKLGPVLLWPINTRSTLQDGLYRYDAVARLQDASLTGNKQPLDIGRYIQLGSLGTALLPTRRPRVLLIDEIDKSDIDLPNDLLHVFEEGHFEIPELARLPEEPQFERIAVRAFDGNDRILIRRGQVQCRAFPVVVLTSNGEREFPPPFLRRCIRLDMQQPTDKELAEIVRAHLGARNRARTKRLIEKFLNRRDREALATDQLLNAIFLATQGIDPLSSHRQILIDAVLRSLTSSGTPPGTP